jgi:3D (Asp-Asp-Asp) domain-containing protein
VKENSKKEKVSEMKNNNITFWILGMALSMFIGTQMAYHDEVTGVIELYHHYPERSEKPVTTKLMRVTAYCAGSCCCGKYADGITASGKPAKGFLVAAPPDIPFGTLLSIEGYAEGLPVPVYDRGGAIKGDRLDVLCDTHQEALEWGVRNINVVFY